MQYDLALEAATKLAGGSVLSEQGNVETLLVADLELQGGSPPSGVETKADIDQVMELYRAIGVRLLVQADKMLAVRTAQISDQGSTFLADEVTGDMYLAEVLRTYAGSSKPIDKLTLAALGLTGESGEVADHIKKVIYQGHTIDFRHLAEELGDVLWYLALACDAIGYSLQEIMLMNVQKLRQRYPNGFEAERSIKRSEW